VTNVELQSGSMLKPILCQAEINVWNSKCEQSEKYVHVLVWQYPDCTV